MALVGKIMSGKAKGDSPRAVVVSASDSMVLVEIPSTEVCISEIDVEHLQALATADTY
jgi:hypothetical protein